MGRRFKLHIDRNAEFELDLAPLLAVMVKLVPVLLMSSAFVQMMIIETELPQIVQEAIKKQEADPNSAKISVTVTKTEGVKITLTEKGKAHVEVVGLNQEKNIDYPALHAKFVALKKSHPAVFKIDIQPDADVAYKDVVKVMDEARKAREKNLKFPVKDEKTGNESTTDYMFPEIVFGNTMDG
ncbi:MAG: biopolymer transporter ExbD [Bdellovibrionota bacterium]